MTTTFLIAQILGFCAAGAACMQHPSHVIYLWGHRKDVSILKGLSLLSILFTTANSIAWGIYGLMYKAYPTALIAVSGTIVMAITVGILVKARMWKIPALIGYILFILLLIFLSLIAPQDQLGFWGNMISIGMWIPAALKVIKVRNTPAALSYPPVTSWTIIITNILWISYGVLLQDIWLWLSAPFSITCALMMLWAYHSTKKHLDGNVVETIEKDHSLTSENS